MMPRHRTRADELVPCHYVDTFRLPAGGIRDTAAHHPGSVPAVRRRGLLRLSTPVLRRRRLRPAGRRADRAAADGRPGRTAYRLSVLTTEAPRLSAAFLAI